MPRKKPEVTRWTRPQVYGCKCGDFYHNMQVWFDPQPDETGSHVTIYMGRWPHGWFGSYGRFALAWRCLKGKPYNYGETLLPLDVAKEFWDELDECIAEAEQNEQRFYGEHSGQE